MLSWRRLLRIPSPSVASSTKLLWRWPRLVSLLLSNFQVTKEGTEGAAATGVEIELFSASFGDQKDVTVDRPFIFVVQDRRNDVPVLVGKVTNPTMI